MRRSFGIVEHKVAEADFFLEKMKDVTFNVSEMEFFVSAFLSATRSITFAIQASISDVEGFDIWYSSIQEKLRQNVTAKFFIAARNMSQKVGYFPISGGHFEHLQDRVQPSWYFSAIDDDANLVVPTDDAVMVCIQYFALLLDVVFECFQKFGYLIDSRQYLTIENISRLGITIEDLEEQMGYPRGWTNGLPDEKRLELLRNNSPEPYIDYFLVKYLGKDRFGNIVESNSASNYLGFYNQDGDG